MGDVVLTGWDIYWLTRLDAVHVAAEFVMVFGVLAAVVSAFFAFGVVGIEERECPRVCKVVMACGAVVVLLAGAVTSAVPTTKEACAIIALPAIANSEDVQGLGREVVDAAREWVRGVGAEKEAEER